MEMFTVSFFGHRKVSQVSLVEERLEAAMQIRKQAMVDRSHLVVCCIEHDSGGAYQAVQYARKQQKQIVNLADLSTHSNRRLRRFGAGFGLQSKHFPIRIRAHPVERLSQSEIGLSLRQICYYSSPIEVRVFSD